VIAYIPIFEPYKGYGNGTEYETDDVRKVVSLLLSKIDSRS